MKTSLFLFVMVAVLLSAAQASAAVRHLPIGGTTFHSFDDGTTGTSTTIGGVTFHDFSNGVSGSGTDVGGMTFDDVDDDPTGEFDWE